MQSENLIVRRAVRSDCKAMMALISELAEYERALDEVETTSEILERDGFGERPLYEAIVAELNGDVIGMALYYFKYSTWKGKCLFLEDFVVKQSMRQLNIGSKLFDQIVLTAKAHQVKRLEWQVLDWNEPAINFYKKYNSELDEEWLNGRLYEHDINRVVQEIQERNN